MNYKKLLLPTIIFIFLYFFILFYNTNLFEGMDEKAEFTQDESEDIDKIDGLLKAVGGDNKNNKK